MNRFTQAGLSVLISQAWMTVWKKPAARIGQVIIKDGKITVGTELD